MCHDHLMIKRVFFFCVSVWWAGCSGTNPCQEGFFRGTDGACHPVGPLFDSGDLESPDSTQFLWTWTIDGEAQLSDLGSPNPQWSGVSTWVYSQEEPSEEICRFELQTRAFGSDPSCEQEPQCDWAFLVEHYEGVGLEGDCEGSVGLVDGEQAAVWQLGYASEWEAREGGVLIAMTEAGRRADQGWVPVGSASLNGSTLRYAFDPIQFFVFTD